jgi:SAM-dependent methyltransferase
MANTVQPDYSTVTELPGARASSQQWARLLHRYHFAALHAAGRDVLEAGCGAGLGLGWLSCTAKNVVGGDYTAPHLQIAYRHYNGRVPLLQFDAAALPFQDHSFDLVVLFEALYYLDRPIQFLAECARVLRPGGMVLIGTVNREWRDFHPSPFARKYYSATELRELLTGSGFSPEIFGAFRSTTWSARGRAFSWLKRTASRSGLIPRTMRGKETLKRVFFGPLEILPAEIIPNGGRYLPPHALNAGGVPCDYTVLYALGRLPGEAAEAAERETDVASS